MNDESPQIESLRKELKVIKELLETRIGSIEDAAKLSHEDFVRVPTLLQTATTNLQELLIQKIEAGDALMNQRIDSEHFIKEEKFSKVEQRFQMVEQQRIEQKKEMFIAVDRAIDTAKQMAAKQDEVNMAAATKTEASLSKQIDQQGVILSTVVKTMDDKLTDLKDRLTRIESTTQGKAAGVTQFLGWIIAAAALIGFLLTHFNIK